MFPKHTNTSTEMISDTINFFLDIETNDFFPCFKIFFHFYYLLIMQEKILMRFEVPRKT